MDQERSLEMGKHRTNAVEKEFILTKEEAFSLLPELDFIVGFKNPQAGIVIDSVYSKYEVEKLFKEAKKIELANRSVRVLGYGIACWGIDNNVTFFQTVEEKIRKIERTRTFT